MHTIAEHFKEKGYYVSQNHTTSTYIDILFHNDAFTQLELNENNIKITSYTTKTVRHSTLDLNDPTFFDKLHEILRIANR